MRIVKFNKKVTLNKIVLALGNFDGVTTNGSTQSRTHNKQNEVLTVSGGGVQELD